MDLPAVAAHDAHQVLHPEGDVRQRMMLGDRDVHELVRLKDVTVQLPRRNRERAPDLRPDELAPLDVVDAEGVRHAVFPREALDGFLDPAAGVAPPRLVARAVEHADGLRPRGEAHRGHGHHDVGVGVRRLFGGAVPPDVGLDDHDVPPGHERLHPPDGGNGLLRVPAGRSPPGHGDGRLRARGRAEPRNGNGQDGDPRRHPRQPQELSSIHPVIFHMCYKLPCFLARIPRLRRTCPPRTRPPAC